MKEAARARPVAIDGPALVLGVFALMLTGAIFALDLLSPPEVCAGARYALVIPYCWLFRSSTTILYFAALCTVLAFAEVFTVGAGTSDMVGINKLISIVVIWISTTLVLFVK